MAALATIATVASGIGTAVQAVGTIAAGRAEQQRLQQEGIAAKEAADFEAAQLDIRAKEERAAGQQEAMQLRRRKKLALSQLQARAAAGGFSATDPTSLALAEEIERYGTLQEQTAMFRGEARGQRLTDTAAGRRFTGQRTLEARFEEGRQARSRSRFSAAATILGGISSMSGRFARRSTPTMTGGFFPVPAR